MNDIGGNAVAIGSLIGVVSSLALGIWSAIRAGRAARQEQRITDTRTALDVWQKTVDELRKQVQDLKERLDEGQVQYEADKKTILALSDALKTLRADADACHKRVDLLEAQLARRKR